MHWSTDVNTGKWKLNTSNAFGQTVNANNGFYQLDRTVNINGGQEMLVTDTYYFANNGIMLVNTVTSDGFLIGIDGKMIN